MGKDKKGIEKKVERLDNYLAKPEGREEVKRALEEAKKGSERLRKAYRIDPQMLHRPVTI